MKIKKILAIIMAICLSVTMLAACGENEGESETSKKPAASAATEKPAATATAEATPTEEPTPKPTPVPVAEDPEVDAKLFRFHYADEYMWAAEGFMTSDDVKLGETAAGFACEYSYEEGEGLKIEVLLEDPYFMIPGTGEDGESSFNLEDYPVFKIRLKNETLATLFEAFATKNPLGANAAEHFAFEISAEDTEYKDYIFDFSANKDDAYFSNLMPLGGIRMDCLSISQDQIDEGNTIVYIDYFGFFKTVEDAENWNPAHVTAAAADETPAATGEVGTDEAADGTPEAAEG